MASIAAPSVLDVPDGELVLRICGSPRQGQIVRLKSGKCTIGSGARCTLRVRARGVRPLHCLILRGAAKTVIRRWAQDTRLNGRAFSDAELAAGDRLGIGPLEFEVLDPDRLPKPGPAQPLQAAKAQPPAQRDDHRRVDLEALAARLGQQEKSLRQQQELLTQQAAALDKRSAEIEQAEAELEAKKRALDEPRPRPLADDAQPHSPSVEGAEKTEAGLAELHAQRESLEHDRQHWEAKLAEGHQRLRHRAEELDARQAQLDAQQQALQTEHQQWKAEQDEAQQRLEATVAEHETLQAKLDNQRKMFEMQRDLWDAEKAEVEGQLNERSGQLDARAKQLDAREAELNSQEAERKATPLQSGADDAAPDEAAPDAGQDRSPSGPHSQQEAQSEQIASGSPLTSEEVFRRMGMLSSLSGAEPEEDLPAPPEPESDESIDDYMARLLERVHQTVGRSTAPQASSRPSEWELEKPPDATPRAEPTEVTSPPPATTEPSEPEEMSPRAVAPEKSVDLTALRELANLSAHAAISRHARRMLFRAFARKLFVIVAGLAAAAALAWMWWTNRAPDSTLYAAGACFLVALLWILQYAVLAGHMTVSKSGRLKWNHKGSQQPAGSGQQAGGSREPAAGSRQQAASSRPPDEQEAQPSP